MVLRPNHLVLFFRISTTTYLGCVFRYGKQESAGNGGFCSNPLGVQLLRVFLAFKPATHCAEEFLRCQWEYIRYLP
jgi:hypothetical protein